MTDESIPAIARGLTRVQRRAIIGAEFHAETGKWRCERVMFPANRNLRLKGLANGWRDELTPLGLAVRAHLQTQVPAGEG